MISNSFVFTKYKSINKIYKSIFNSNNNNNDTFKEELQKLSETEKWELFGFLNNDLLEKKNEFYEKKNKNNKYNSKTYMKLKHEIEILAKVQDRILSSLIPKKIDTDSNNFNKNTKNLFKKSTCSFTNKFKIYIETEDNEKEKHYIDSDGNVMKNNTDNLFEETNIKKLINKVKIEKEKISFLDCFVNSHSYKFLSITNEYNFPLTAFLSFEDGILYPQKPFYFDQHIYLESSSVTSIKISFHSLREGEFTENLFICFTPYNFISKYFFDKENKIINNIILKGQCSNSLIRVNNCNQLYENSLLNGVKYYLEKIPFGGKMTKRFTIFNCIEKNLPVIIRLKTKSMSRRYFQILKYEKNHYFNDVKEFQNGVTSVLLPRRSLFKCFVFRIIFSVPLEYEIDNLINANNQEMYEAELVIEKNYTGYNQDIIFNLPIQGSTYNVNFSTLSNKFMLFNEHHTKTCFELISDSTFSTSVTVHLLPEFIDSSSQIKHSIFNPPQLLPSHSSSSLSQIWNVLPLEYTIPAKGKLSIQICCNVYKKNNPYNFLQNQFNEAFIKIFVLPNGPFYKLILLSLPLNSYFDNLTNYDVYSPMVLENEIVLGEDKYSKSFHIINPVKKSLKSVNKVWINLSELFFKQFNIPNYSEIIKKFKKNYSKNYYNENNLNNVISFPLQCELNMYFNDNSSQTKKISIKIKIEESILKTALKKLTSKINSVNLKFVSIFGFSPGLQIDPTSFFDCCQNYILKVQTSLKKKYSIERMSVMNTIGKEVTVELIKNSPILCQNEIVNNNLFIGFYCKKIKIKRNEVGELCLKCMFLIPGEYFQSWMCEVTCGNEKQRVKFNIYLSVDI